MSRELESTAGGTIEPYAADGNALIPYVPSPPSRSGAPDYTVIRPHINGLGQAQWSKIITPYRAFLHFQLWLTLTWWRVAIFNSVLILIVLLIVLS